MWESPSFSMGVSLTNAAILV